MTSAIDEKNQIPFGRSNTTFLITQRQAADFLGCSPRSLEAWRLRGGGPRYVKLGRRCVRYLLSDLSDWVGSHVRTSTSDLGAADGGPRL
jgi:predicted DNA-binding transcriptional regulator AlpA